MNKKTLETMFDKIKPDDKLVERTKQLMGSAAGNDKKKYHAGAPAFRLKHAALLAVITAATILVMVMRMPATYDGYFTEKGGFSPTSDTSVSLYSTSEDAGIFLQEGLTKPDFNDESSLSKFQDEFKSYAKAVSGSDCGILEIEGRVVSLQTYTASDDKYDVFGFHMMQIEITHISLAKNSPDKYKTGDKITAFYYVKDSSKINEKPAVGSTYSMYLYTGKGGDPADRTGQLIGIRKSWILSAAFPLGAH